jgi:nucleotide-binding universal stress UspA family protein
MLVAPVNPLSVIVHPTDFTASSASAFAHSLAMALVAKARLCLLHVREEHAPPPTKSEFKHVRDILVGWGVLPKDASPAAIESDLGLRVSSVSVPAKNARAGILDYLDDHPCDLVVLATHPAKGKTRWFDVSVEQGILRKTRVVSLFLRDGARSFVDVKTGALLVKKVLIPIDGKLDCIPAIRRLEAKIKLISPSAEFQLLYIGEKAPELTDHRGKPVGRPIMVRTGPVVETILGVARSSRADLIAMPTAGRHGLLDALRGSTTAAVLEDARWPLVTIPVVDEAGPDMKLDGPAARPAPV